MERLEPLLQEAVALLPPAVRAASADFPPIVATCLIAATAFVASAAAPDVARSLADADRRLFILAAAVRCVAAFASAMISLFVAGRNSCGAALVLSLSYLATAPPAVRQNFAALSGADDIRPQLLRLQSFCEATRPPASDGELPEIVDAIGFTPLAAHSATRVAAKDLTASRAVRIVRLCHALGEVAVVWRFGQTLLRWIGRRSCTQRKCSAPSVCCGLRP